MAETLPLAPPPLGRPILKETAAGRRCERPPRPPIGPECTPALGAIATESGLERVRIVAWRDLDDPEAGGSELHAHRIAGLWASAGIDVEMRTSTVPRTARFLERDGYQVSRRGGRYSVFARRGMEELFRRPSAGEGLVEIWNGMPFWSPLWFRGPRVVFLHHVHAEMWRMVLPRWMASIGAVTEKRVAPRVYRSTRVVTLSESSRAEIVEVLGFDGDRVTVVPPGVDPCFSPGAPEARSSGPLVVAVGRLVPVKRYDLLMHTLARVRRSVPSLRAVIAGEGYQRPRLEALRRALGATAWLSLPGHVSNEELVTLYRSAWMVASASQREGWGMTLTEAGACATPAVASDIAGHRDAIVQTRTGLLAHDETEIAAAITRVVRDADLRARLGAGALAHARGFTWEAAARGALQVLAEEACWAAEDYRLSFRPGVGVRAGVVA